MRTSSPPILDSSITDRGIEVRTREVRISAPPGPAGNSDRPSLRVVAAVSQRPAPMGTDVVLTVPSPPRTGVEPEREDDKSEPPQAFGGTHIGRRMNNEDCYALEPDFGLFVVADGMGGHEGGEVASMLAVETTRAYWRRLAAQGEKGFETPASNWGSVAEKRMNMSFRLAHQEVMRRRTGKLREMGCTLVAMLFGEGQAVLAHVGDSRAYRYRGRHLQQLTRDHSLKEELGPRNSMAVAALTGKDPGSVITRAIGVPGDSDPDIRTLDVQPGDLYLLCTDGLTDAVEDWRIAELLAENAPSEVSSKLLFEALDNGGNDNITVVVVEAI